VRDRFRGRTVSVDLAVPLCPVAGLEVPFLAGLIVFVGVRKYVDSDFLGLICPSHKLF